MSFQPDWDKVQPEHKWSILLRLRRFAFWALFSSLGSVMFGFDNAISGTATAMAAFQKEFGIPWPEEPSGYLVPARVQSAWSGAASGGAIIGELLAGQLIERIGRKHTMGLASVITAVGVAIQVGARDWKLFLVGRLVSAIGYGMVFLLSPVWIGETVRPELRGFFLCLMNGSIVLGQLLLACAARGTSTIVGKWSYKWLIIMQFLFVVALMMLYPFYPESPYYLVKRGEYEQARNALNRIHSPKDQALINAEMRRIERDVSFSEALRTEASNKGPLIIQCFQGMNLKRTMIACLPALAQQLIGAAFVLGYVTYFLSLLHVNHYFTVSAVLYVVMLLSNASAFFLIETCGRRVLLVPGLVVLTVTLLLMGIMGCLHGMASTWVSVVCIFIWAIAYQSTVGAMGFALGSEVASLPLRASTESLLAVTTNGVGWVIGYATPYMINPDAGNLGAKVGFVFTGLGVPLCVLFYFYIPETKGLTFEELDYLFSQKTSCRHFQDAVRSHHEDTGNPAILENAQIDSMAPKAVDVDDGPQAPGQPSRL